MKLHNPECRMRVKKLHLQSIYTHSFSYKLCYYSLTQTKIAIKIFKRVANK